MITTPRRRAAPTRGRGRRAPPAAAGARGCRRRAPRRRRRRPAGTGGPRSRPGGPPRPRSRPRAGRPRGRPAAMPAAGREPPRRRPCAAWPAWARWRPARRRVAARRAALVRAGVVPERALAGDQAAVLDRERARGQRLDQRAVVRHEQDGAGKAQERVLERLAALDVEVVGGLVEHEEVRARDDRACEREPPPLAAREGRDRLLDVVAREQEQAEQVARGRAR